MTRLSERKMENRGAIKRFVHDSKNPQWPTILFAPFMKIAPAGCGLNGWRARSIGSHHTKNSKHYTEKDGLPNNKIWGILEDDRGRLWLSTNNGISCFDPSVSASSAFKNYTVRDGLSHQEFNRGAWFKSDNGEMFFGSMNGVTVFHPDSIRDNPFVPPVVITACKRYNTDDAEGIAIVERGISARQEIKFSYKDNIISFEFVALSFRNAEQNQYAYKLEGYREQWIQLGTHREATFTNLDPGEYVLRVKASNNDGVWNEEAPLHGVKITITPPWWRTRWAYSIYALLVITGGFVTNRIQRQRLIKKERERAEAERKERELKKAEELKIAYEKLTEAHERLKVTQQQLLTQEKLASLGQLTAGIAHEIKNPLNFVNNFAALSVDLAKELQEELERRKAKGDGRGAESEEHGAKGEDEFKNIEEILETLIQNAEKINHHGKRADSIVKSMMQHARGSSGQRELVDINHLLDEAVNLVYHGMRLMMLRSMLRLKRYDETK
jgi:signal transduction histidine kinase